MATFCVLSSKHKEVEEEPRGKKGRGIVNIVFINGGGHPLKTASTNAPLT